MQRSLEIALRLCAFLWLAVATPRPTTASAADWPHIHGPHLNRTTPETVPAENFAQIKDRQIWQFSCECGFSSFVSGGGNVYTVVAKSLDGEDREVCLAHDQKTSHMRWSLALGKAEYDGGGDSGAGSNRGGDGPRATPTYADGRLFILDAHLKLWAIDAANGRLLWTRDLVGEFGGKVIHWQNAASPLRYRDAILVAGGGKGQTYLSFDAATGKLHWKAGDDTITHATPVGAIIAGKPQAIFMMHRGIVAIDPENGEELWHFPFPFNVSTAASPVVWNNIVYCSAGYDVGAAACRVTATASGGLEVEELWRAPGNKLLANHWSTPVCVDGFLYGIYDFKKYGKNPLKCVDLRTGEIQWEEPGFGQGNLILTGENRLLVLADYGTLTLVQANPKQYVKLGEADVIEGKCWSTPMIADGVIYVRSTTQGVALKP